MQRRTYADRISISSTGIALAQPLQDSDPDSSSERSDSSSVESDSGSNDSLGFEITGWNLRTPQLPHNRLNLSVDRDTPKQITSRVPANTAEEAAFITPSSVTPCDIVPVSALASFPTKRRRYKDTLVDGLASSPLNTHSEATNGRSVSRSIDVASPLGSKTGNQQSASIVNNVHQPSTHIRYRCASCKDTYVTVNQLVTHLREHHKDTQYVCDDCRMGFFTAATFKDHLMRYYLHMRSDPASHRAAEHDLVGSGSARLKYHCSCRDKVYKTIGTLVEHRRTLHESAPWVCDKCGHDFGTASRFKKHLLDNPGHMQVMMVEPGGNAPLDQSVRNAVASCADNASNRSTINGTGQERGQGQRSLKVSSGFG